MKKLFSKSLNFQRPNSGLPLLFAVAFAAVGSIILYRSFAATSPNAKVAEGETYVSANDTSVASDGTASGSSFLQFNPVSTGGTCDLNASNATTLASQITAATVGQTICLASGNYGTFAGTNKAITIKAAAGATATMLFNFTTGDNGFTLDGLSGAGGTILNGAKDITIKNTAFTTSLTIDGVTNSNILLDSNTHININFPSSGSGTYACADVPAGAIHFPYSQATHSGVTVRNSLFKGGHKDGIQSGVGVNIINNEFDDIAEHGAVCTGWWDTSPHSDPIQLIGATGSIVRGNYIHNVADGIVAYDGVDNVLIENNVVDIQSGRWGIELYSDTNSIVRYNTLVYRTTCDYAPCGHIILSRKTSDPVGTGTQVYDNVAYVVSLQNSSTAAVNRNNMLRSGVSGQNFSGVPVFEGGSNPTTWEGFKLAANSPGITGASDGGPVGIRQR